MPDATIRNAVGLGRNPEVNRGPAVVDATVATGAAATQGTVYRFFAIPTNARIHGTSRLWHDDLASTGSPTIDIGLYPVDGNFAADADALNDGIDVAASAGANIPVVKAHENYGRMAWEFVDGLTSDPGGVAIVGVVLADANANTGGDITITLHYSVD